MGPAFPQCPHGLRSHMDLLVVVSELPRCHCRLSTSGSFHLISHRLDPVGGSGRDLHCAADRYGRKGGTLQASPRLHSCKSSAACIDDLGCRLVHHVLPGALRVLQFSARASALTPSPLLVHLPGHRPSSGTKSGGGTEDYFSEIRPCVYWNRLPGTA